ncbi:MAG: DNA helicase PcrA [Bacillota bacterium]|nr:DNA helicase PcrA [Bacillota bacterium]
MDTAPLLANLNSQQREAATYLGGPVLVFAGAGSGKTRVLTYRIAHLLSMGIHPANILAITFTNKAAEEMKGRVQSLLGPQKDLWISTFHSLCARLLRRDGHLIGLDRSFVIYDTQDQMTAIKQVIGDSGLDSKRYQPGSVLAQISAQKNELVDAEEYERRAQGFYEERIAQLYKQYQRLLNKNVALDFDDLLVKACELLQGSRPAREHYQERFHHILVDEYQDTNHAQYMLVSLLAQKHRNLLVVGDDDQNIYTFRGASLRNILEFEKDYPEAKVIRLEQNYRSTQNILDAAYYVVKNNAQRVGKRLWTENPQGQRVVLRTLLDESEEGQFVIDEILSLRSSQGLACKDFAVLYRTHAQSRVFEESLIRREVPYIIVGGIRFYERREIKDILAYLRLITGSSDFISLERIINVPKRGIGEATLARIEGFSREKGLPVVETLSLAQDIPGLAGPARSKVAAFGKMLEGLMEDFAGRTVYETTEAVLGRTGYADALKADGSIEAITRLENIEEFLTVALEFDRRGEGGLQEFLEGVSLVSDIDTVDERKDAVMLMTLHSAKGLEFPVVFLVGMEEGVFPHARSIGEMDQIEEERRLCYVGMTRAKRLLYMVHTQVRTLYGRTTQGIRSRFIEEIPAELLEAPDQVAAAGVNQETGGERWGTGGGSGGPAQQTSPNRRDQSYESPRRKAQSKWEPPPFSGETEFRVGDRVVHPKLGPGTVVSAKGAGMDTEVSVAFPGKGIKTLIARYANLTKE